MGFLKFIPAMLIPVLLYAFIAAPSGANAAQTLANPLFSFHLASGDLMALSLGSVLTIIAVLCLFFEILKSTIPNKRAIFGNMTTAILLVLSIGVFLLVRGFGTAEFFLITLLLLLDYLSESAIMVFTSRRTVEYTHDH